MLGKVSYDYEIGFLGDYSMVEEDRIKMLSELNDRECIVRVNSQGLILPAIKAKYRK